MWGCGRIHLAQNIVQGRAIVKTLMDSEFE
jgi:hypothetical protein